METKNDGPTILDWIGIVLSFCFAVLIALPWVPLILLGGIACLFDPATWKKLSAELQSKESRSPTISALLLLAIPISVFLVLLVSGMSSGNSTGGNFSNSSKSIYHSSVIDNNVKVESYTRNNGTNVPSHYRSSPDSTKQNNWSSYPNVNPITGKLGRHRVSD